MLTAPSPPSVRRDSAECHKLRRKLEKGPSGTAESGRRSGGAAGRTRDDSVMSTSPRFPGTPAICDGSEAIASVETRISEGACSYPITPSTTMPAVYQAAVADGRTNLWGTPLAFLEPESEHSSATAAEGFALAGGRVVNFTAGQGLILMKEVLYVIAGKRLPVVFHIGARALTSQSLNIHAGHDDVMGVADCGWGILFARNVQEAADFTAIARRVAEETSTPFFVVQDGFLTTHTLENAQPARGRPAARVRRRSARAPHEPVRPGHRDHERRRRQPGRVHAGQDRAARLLRASSRRRCDAAFAEWAELTGRQLRSRRRVPRSTDAETVLVAMGTIADSARAVVDHLRAGGRPVGTLGVTAFRPFPADAAGRRARRRPRRRGGRAHRRARRGRQPAHPRAEGGAGRPCRARRVDPDRRLGLRRARQPGRLRR